MDRIVNQFNHPMYKPINELETMQRKQLLEIKERSKKIIGLLKWDHIKKVKS